MEIAYVRYPEGSVLYSSGDTRVLCNASVSDKTAPFLRGSGEGWVTAEYSMLPRATDTRNERDVKKGRISGRSHEIQRLIGRSLRAAVKMDRLGERSLMIDCDVIQADGSTRCASISGGWTALALALARMYTQGLINTWPLSRRIAAVSVGLVRGEICVDLDYTEDFSCDVDLNLVFTGTGDLVEVQGTAEGETFSPSRLGELVKAGWTGALKIFEAQEQAVMPVFESAGLKSPPGP